MMLRESHCFIGSQSTIEKNVLETSNPDEQLNMIDPRSKVKATFNIANVSRWQMLGKHLTVTK